MTDAEKEIREALAAGPTPGPWSVKTVPTSCGICHKVGPFPGKQPDSLPRHACLYADYPIQGNPADDELEANARFIAACHPAAIRELLDEIERLRADARRYRWLRIGHNAMLLMETYRWTMPEQMDGAVDIAIGKIGDNDTARGKE